MTLSKKIEHLRKTKKMTQDFLADKLGVSRQTIYKWEAGENKPEIDKLVTLSKLFDVSLDFLLDDTLDTEDESAPVKSTRKSTAPTYRRVFVSKSIIHAQQAAFDHDSPPEDYDGINPFFWDAFRVKQTTLQAELRAKGYTRSINLRQDVAMCFFVDQKRKVFGIYGNHQEYFVCPFENFISATHTGGGKHSMTTTRHNVGALIGGVRGLTFSNDESNQVFTLNDHKLIISYFKKDGTTGRYVVPCDFDTSYMLTEKTNYKDPEFGFQLMSNCAIDSARQNISKIIIALSEIKATAERDKRNGEKYLEIDLDFYKRNETKGRELYDSDLTIARCKMDDYIRQQRTKKVCLWVFGVPIAIIVIIFLILLLVR